MSHLSNIFDGFGYIMSHDVSNFMQISNKGAKHKTPNLATARGLWEFAPSFSRSVFVWSKRMGPRRHYRKGAIAFRGPVGGPPGWQRLLVSQSAARYPGM